MSTPPREAAELSPAQIAKRDRIIATAVDVLLSDGVHGCTVRAIAQHAGVSKGTVHYYFDDVDQIVDAAMLRATEAWITWLSHASESGVDGAEHFWYAIDASLVPFASGDRAVMPLWLEYWAMRVRAGDCATLVGMQQLLSSFVGDLLKSTGVDRVEEKAVGVTAYLFGIAMQESNGPIDATMVRRHVAAICGLQVGR